MTFSIFVHVIQFFPSKFIDFYESIFALSHFLVFSPQSWYV